MSTFLSIPVENGLIEFLDPVGEGMNEPVRVQTTRGGSQDVWIAKPGWGVAGIAPDPDTTARTNIIRCEALGYLVASLLGCQVPEFAQGELEGRQVWLSKQVKGLHWDESLVIRVPDLLSMATVCVLDALLNFDDRHLHNVIAKPEGSAYGIVLIDFDHVTSVALNYTFLNGPEGEGVAPAPSGFSRTLSGPALTEAISDACEKVRMVTAESWRHVVSLVKDATMASPAWSEGVTTCLTQRARDIRSLVELQVPHLSADEGGETR